MYASLVFNEVVGLHVHHQQQYKFVVDHEFLDVLGWQWSLHATVVHIGATKEEGHFVVYVVFDDKWWLCDDTTVKGLSRPPNPRKADLTFVLHKRKRTDLIVPDMSQAASQRTGASTLGKTRDAQSIPINTSVPGMALAPGAPPPPPATQGASRVGDKKGTMHAHIMPIDASVLAIAVARGAPPPSPAATVVHQG